MQLFSSDATIFKKKIIFFLAPENIIGPDLFISTDLAAQTAQKQKSRTTKSSLMQDCVFRLGA